MKAVVLETRGREAAVLAMDGGVYIAHGRYRVGETIDYKEAKRPSARQWVAAAAAMVALLGTSAGLWVDRNYVAYAEVSLDVNPSIVYTINRRDRVLGVRAVNEDAKGIVESLEQDGIRFATLNDAVDRTMALLENDGYLDEAQTDYVLVNVSADDDDRKTRLTGEVEEAMSKTMERDTTLEYRIDTSDRATAKDARDNGMSTGRYAAWKQKEEKPGDARYDMEAYSDMPVKEIIGGPSADDDRALPENEGAGAIPQPETPATPMETDPGATEPEEKNDSPAMNPQDSAEPRERAAAMDEEPEKESVGNDRNSQKMGVEKPATMQEDNSRPGGDQQVSPEPQEKSGTNGEGNRELPTDQRQPDGNDGTSQGKANGYASTQTDGRAGGRPAGESAGGIPNKAQGNPERGGGPSGSGPQPGR